MDRPFLFGKLPAHGDFVSRGLSASYRMAWDIWCTEGLIRAQDMLGEAFDARHRQAGAGCYWFGPGPYGRHWRTGAMIATRDRASRPFILVMGVETKTPPCEHVAQTYSEALHCLLEDAIKNARVADEVVGRAPALPPCPDHARHADTDGGRFWTRRGGVTRTSAFASAPPPDFISDMLNVKEVIDVGGPAI